MGLLANSTVYMAGAVEAASDPHNWRNILSQRLLELRIISWDPMIKPSWFQNITVEEQRLWKETIRKQHDSSLVLPESYAIWEKNKQLRQFCLHMVANANFVIVKLDKTFSVGTFFELSLCKYKPVFVLSDDPAISTWLVAELDIDPYEIKDYFYKDIDSLMLHLSMIDAGTTPYNFNKWMFLTYKQKGM